MKFSRVFLGKITIQTPIWLFIVNKTKIQLLFVRILYKYYYMNLWYSLFLMSRKIIYKNLIKYVDGSSIILLLIVIVLYIYTILAQVYAGLKSNCSSWMSFARFNWEHTSSEKWLLKILSPARTSFIGPQ